MDLSFEKNMEWMLDRLPVYLMWIAGVMLAIIIGIQVGMWKGKEMEREYLSNELKTMSNELKEAEARLKEMEKELEHQKLIKAIAICESSGRHDGVWGDSGKSYGMFQFQHATFKKLAGKMGFKNARWKDKGHQLIVASWAIRNGHGDLWTCYRRLTQNTDTDTKRREG